MQAVSFSAHLRQVTGFTGNSVLCVRAVFKEAPKNLRGDPTPTTSSSIHHTVAITPWHRFGALFLLKCVGPVALEDRKTAKAAAFHAFRFLKKSRLDGLGSAAIGQRGC